MSLRILSGWVFGATLAASLVVACSSSDNGSSTTTTGTKDGGTGGAGGSAGSGGKGGTGGTAGGGTGGSAGGGTGGSAGGGTGGSAGGTTGDPAACMGGMNCGTACTTQNDCFNCAATADPAGATAANKFIEEACICGGGDAGAPTCASACGTDVMCSGVTGQEMLSQGCITCLNGLQQTDACLTTYANLCKADAQGCLAFVKTLQACNGLP